MKFMGRPLVVLTFAVALLAALACGAALLPALGGAADATSFVSLRGETVPLEGAGLYRNDSVSFATQAKAQDLVTLVIGIPLLLVSLRLASRGSLRGALLLAGTFAYFTYTYATYAFGLQYNPLFLVYVALLSSGVMGLILSLRALSAEEIKARFRGPLVRRLAVGFDFFVGAMLLLMWLSRIISGKTLIEHYTTLPIQVMDLAFVVPLAIIAGVNLAADKALGYLLTGIFFLKGLSLCLALAAMMLWAAIAGQSANPVETAIFCAIIAGALAMAGAYIRAIGS